jgi:hypothetical protein
MPTYGVDASPVIAQFNDTNPITGGLANLAAALFQGPQMRAQLEQQRQSQQLAGRKLDQDQSQFDAREGRMAEMAKLAQMVELVKAFMGGSGGSHFGSIPGTLIEPGKLYNTKTGQLFSQEEAAKGPLAQQAQVGSPLGTINPQFIQALMAQLAPGMNLFAPPPTATVNPGTTVPTPTATTAPAVVNTQQVKLKDAEAAIRGVKR